ncbi:transporter substrate-binding domain-containing protein [Vibrio profundum]|uniref:substrate-binding periplasmic protein n=1 Tax=Vibrio profundum TaxID=2910247 RepID=UPI003D0F3FA4
MPTITQAKTLKISTVELVPVGFKNEHNQPSGLLYDIANAIADNAQLPYVNTLKPYPRILLELESGTADISMLYPNKRLKGKVVNIAKIFTDSNVIVARPEFTIRSLTDLHGKKVATIRNAHYSSEFDSDVNITKVSVNNYNQGIRLLLHGRVDAIIGALGSISYELKTMDTKWDAFGQPYVLNTKTVWMQMSSKNYDRKLVDKLISSINTLKQQGVLKEIIVKYTGETLIYY